MAPQIRRRKSCLSSCFSSSPVSDDDDDMASDQRTSRLFSLSSFRRKKQTVPINAPEEIGDVVHAVSNSQAAATNKEKLPKDNKRMNIIKHHQHNQVPSTTTKVVSGIPQKKPCVNHISTKCNTQTRLTSLHQMHDPMKIGSIMSHTNSPKSTNIHTSSRTPRSFSCNSQKKREENMLDPNVGLVVLAMTLVVMLLLGRAYAIVFMSAWFYLLPRLRLQATIFPVVNSSTKEASDHVSSEENKKRVVLQGLLERNKRKSPFIGTTPAI